jgi:hypothetical protein
MTASDFLSGLKTVRNAGPGRWVACCPAHPDRNPSLSIATGADGRILVRCFAGCSLPAILTAMRLSMRDLFATNHRIRPTLPPPPESSRPPMPLPADLRCGTGTELAALATSRGLNGVAGLEILTQRQILWFTDQLRDGLEPAGTSWLLTDSARLNAQARRLDGHPWQAIGGKKARTMRGWKASWPIGLADIHEFNRPAVLLVEGGPDLLAAATVAWSYAAGGLDDIGFACMTGAGNRLPSEALPLFKGRRVIIPFHVDDEGLKAAARWELQLIRAGAHAISFSLKGLTTPHGTPVKDLNDAVSSPELHEMVEALFFLPT